MRLIIGGERIEVTGIPVAKEIDWKSILDELKAEHLPGFYRPSRRMEQGVSDGLMYVRIYRTEKTPTEEVIREILGDTE
jgi:hypothetical protein